MNQYLHAHLVLSINFIRIKMSFQIIHRYIDALIAVSPSCDRLNRNQLHKLKESLNVNQAPDEFASRLQDIIFSTEDYEDDDLYVFIPFSEDEYIGRVFEEMFGLGDSTLSQYTDIIKVTF